MVTQVTRKVPARASQFVAGACEFAAGEPSGNNSRGPIQLIASSGAVFNHWYWGPMVFDVSGMKLSKPRVTLDYCHRQDEVVGYADRIDATGGQLKIAGELVSTKRDDRAAALLVKGPAGVPYEASIKFDLYNQLVIEEYSAGVPAQVNGRMELGPLTVVRECLIRGVAVCPYGADPYTQSEFSAAGDDADVSITIQQHGETHEMADPTPEPKETKPKTPDQIRSELVAANQDYATRFGAELAAKWGPLGENKPLLECYAEFTAKLQADHGAALEARDAAHKTVVTELQAKLAEAEKKAADAEARLASLSLGEEKPVSGGGEPPAIPMELQAALTPGLAKFVAAQRGAKAGAA